MNKADLEIKLGKLNKEELTKLFLKLKRCKFKTNRKN